MSLQYVNKKIDLIQINLLSKKFFCTSASFPSTGTVFIFKKEQQEIFLKDRKKKIHGVVLQLACDLRMSWLW